MMKNILRFLSGTFTTLIVSTMLVSAIPTSAEEVEDPLIVVSLGDSYSAGEGIEPFYYQWQPISEKVNNEGWYAHRSEKSWPSQLEFPDNSGNFYLMKDYDYKDEWNKNNPTCRWYFRAVSGAETKNIRKYEDSADYKGSQKKKIQKKDWNGGKELYKSIPNQLAVFDDINYGTVDYVTLTIGGNDVKFSDVVERCATKVAFLNLGDKEKTLDDMLKELWDNIDSTMNDIGQVYKDIAEVAGPQATIIVAGYPKLFNEKGSGVLISEDEATKVNNKVHDFNKKIRERIGMYQNQGMNIVFVDVEKEFEGHEAYTNRKKEGENEMWINPIILGHKDEDINNDGHASAYSVHPNQYGAKAYAKCVNAEIKKLTNKGTLSGKIVKASDRITPVENANISISNGDVIYSTVADSLGNYTFNLPVGDYQIDIDAPGYVDFKAYVTVIPKETVYMETFLLVEGSENETGTASGTVFDGLTSLGISGVDLIIRDGWNNPSKENSTIISEISTDENGNYSVDLPYGNYTVTAIKNGYISSSFNIISQEGITGEQNGTMTSVVSEDSYRIILTWGENPNDLDSHVEGKLSDGSSFHTYFEDMSHYDGNIEVCNLDVDDVTSYEPETITLNPTTDNAHYYYIYKYDGSGTVATSGAQIKLYKGDTLLNIFNVPTNLGESDYWNVFAIKNGEIIVHNTITENAETDYAE